MPWSLCMTYKSLKSSLCKSSMLSIVYSSGDAHLNEDGMGHLDTSPATQKLLLATKTAI